MLQKKMQRIPMIIIIVADDASPQDNLESIVDKHVTRLMSLRHHDWGWENSPQVILAFQLSNQQSLFAKDRAIQAMELEFEKEKNRLSYVRINAAHLSRLLF